MRARGKLSSNDYVIRFENRFFQLLPPAHPGLRRGRVIVERRGDGSLAIRFGTHWLRFQELSKEEALGGAAPKPPEFNASAADASGKAPEPANEKSERGRTGQPRSPGIEPTNGRSGRTPAEPYPSAGTVDDKPKKPYRPAANHPWR